jgi:hypothetical protein
MNRNSRISRISLISLSTLNSKIFLISQILLFIIFSSGCKNQIGKSVLERQLPQAFSWLIDSIRFGTLGGIKPEVAVENSGDSVIRVSLTFQLPDSVQQDDWQLNLYPSFHPDFFWAPHLTPTNDHIIAQHVFRSPALIMADTVNRKQIVMIPDLDLLINGSPVKWYLDMDAQTRCMTLGMSKSRVREHVLFTREKGARYPSGRLEIAFYLMASTDKKSIENPWRKPAAFLWDKWGKALFNAGQPLDGDLESYTKHTYNWAFVDWKDAVWQEFNLNGTRVGAPVFIVNVTQSPNYPGPVNEREFRSVWNQAWFSSLRSASGLFRYAHRTNNADLLEKARLTKELALAFPQKDGIFPGLIGTEMTTIEIAGKKYNRSKGWDHYYFGNSNRNPYTWDPQASPYHILDMSWTANLMLQWYEELEQDKRLLDYAVRYADKLVELQSPEGYFPGWLDIKTLQVLPILNHSPESSLSATFLLKLSQITGNAKYKTAALKALNIINKEIIPSGQWEDFETYWSCSSFGSDTLVNKRITRNHMFKQNTLSIYWTAEAMLAGYRQTGEDHFLKMGQRTLDELLMAQAVWQPPYMFINTLGGFGVMNSDGEWNDSRESLFAELIMEYGKELNMDEYKQRGLSALKSSFVMMYCPENPKTKVQWEKKWPFFNQKDYGFTMENYGHGGETNPDGLGIGEFTIYDWGNGAAAEAYNRIRDHFGNSFVIPAKAGT